MRHAPLATSACSESTHRAARRFKPSVYRHSFSAAERVGVTLPCFCQDCMTRGLEIPARGSPLPTILAGAVNVTAEPDIDLDT